MKEFDHTFKITFPLKKYLIGTFILINGICSSQISDDIFNIVLDTTIKITPLPSLTDFNPSNCLLQDISLFDKAQFNQKMIIPINEKYSIGFGDSVGKSNYCDAYVLENGVSTLLKFPEYDDSHYCGFTGYFDSSPNGRYIILELIDRGLVDDGIAQEFHENYFCWLVDLQNKKVIAQYQSRCGGEWTANNEWVYGDEILFKPE